MKKLIGWILVFVLGVVSTLVYLAWRDRSESREDPGLSVAEARSVKADVVERFEKARQRDGSSTLMLSETDLEALVAVALAEHPRKEDLVRVVREVDVEVGDDALGVGVAVDLEALERSGLVDAEMLERLLNTLPFLRGRELNLAFRGRPGARDGKIGLIDDLEATLGFLTLPIDAFEDRLGFSAERVYRQLVFDVSPFEVEEVQAREGELTLEVRSGN